MCPCPGAATPHPAANKGSGLSNVAAVGKRHVDERAQIIDAGIVLAQSQEDLLGHPIPAQAQRRYAEFGAMLVDHPAGQGGDAAAIPALTSMVSAARILRATVS